MKFNSSAGLTIERANGGTSTQRSCLQDSRGSVFSLLRAEMQPYRLGHRGCPSLGSRPCFPCSHLFSWEGSLPQRCHVSGLRGLILRFSHNIFCLFSGIPHRWRVGIGMWFSAKVSVYTADLIFCLRVSFIQSIFIKHQRPALICSTMRISGNGGGCSRGHRTLFWYMLRSGGPVCVHCTLFPPGSKTA